MGLQTSTFRLEISLARTLKIQAALADETPTVLVERALREYFIARKIDLITRPQMPPENPDPSSGVALVASASARAAGSPVLAAIPSALKAPSLPLGSAEQAYAGSAANRTNQKTPRADVAPVSSESDGEML